MEGRWQQRKWIIPVIIPLLLFMLFNSFYSVPLLRRSIVQEKESQIKDLTYMGVSILDHFYSMEETGQLTRRDAQMHAKSLIRDLRFGPESRDYYWINDFEPEIVVHPLRSDLEEVDLHASQNDEYIDLFVSFVEIAENKGEGYIEYQWQYYDQQQRLEPKISYVKAFEPWGWIIGTGLYLDDVESAAQSQRNIIFIVILTGLQLLLAVGVIYKVIDNKRKQTWCDIDE